MIYYNLQNYSVDPLIKNIPRLNIRFRQYRMSGRWIEYIPFHCERLDPALLQYNNSRDAAEFIKYWERLFYENPHDVPEMSEQFDNLTL